jgi:Uma2 family endonuclease
MSLTTSTNENDIYEPGRSILGESGVARRKITVDEYYKCLEAGVFTEDEHLELIDGEVIANLSPHRAAHASSIRKVTRAIARILLPDTFMQAQLPVRLSNYNEPEPDVAVCRGGEDDFERRHPAPDDILLAIEVADTTLRQDLIAKNALYAQFSIPEYWVVNVVQRRLVVFRDPISIDGQPTYAVTIELTPEEAVAPLFAPDAAIIVETLLPKTPLAPI